MKGWKETYKNIVEPKEEISERLEYHKKSQAEKLKLLFNSKK